MKKLFACILILALLCGATALADFGDRMRVVNCNDYVTLRLEPDTSSEAMARIPRGALVDEVGWWDYTFRRVQYNGQVGYVLGDYLAEAQTYRGDEVALSSKQRYNINLFLSNFTEQGFLWRAGCYDIDNVDTVRMTEFAIDHCWFNRKNRLEWGDYFYGNNVRLPEDQIEPIVWKYFGVGIAPEHDLNYIDYSDGWYYWEETGGHTNDGFACLYSVESLGNGRYSVWFDVYGMGEDWDNDVCYYDWPEAEEDYPPYGSIPTGRAVIDTGVNGLNDRSDWRIERYTINYD